MVFAFLIMGDEKLSEVERCLIQRSAAAKKLQQDFDEYKPLAQEGDTRQMRSCYLRAKGRYERYIDVAKQILERGNEEQVGEVAEEMELMHDIIATMAADNGTVIEPASQERTTRSETALAEALPKVKLSKFNGDLSEWDEWWDIYETLVHKQRHLGVREKFSILKSHLRDEAKATITYLPLKEE